MLELKYKILRKGDLEGATAKLSASTKFNPKQALKIFKLVDELVEQKEKLQAEYLDLAKEHAVLDEKGRMKPDEDFNGKPVPNSFATKDKDLWKKAVEEFGEKAFKIDAEALPVSVLEGLNLTPLEMAALAPVIIEE